MYNMRRSILRLTQSRLQSIQLCPQCRRHQQRYQQQLAQLLPRPQRSYATLSNRPNYPHGRPQTSPFRQIRDRLAANDLRGALDAHDELLLRGSEYSEDAIPTLSALLQALCMAKRREYAPQIRQLLGEFRDRHLPIDATTTAALVYMHLGQGQRMEAEEMLMQGVDKWSREDRQTLVGVFVRHIVAETTSTTDAWESYLQMREYLSDSVDLPAAEALVKSYLSRRRADMASAVLSHLSAESHSSSSMSTAPTLPIFMLMLDGAAALHDAESLRLTHNLLKVSLTIEPSTALSNALMKAYLAVGQQDIALNLWNDIADSLEGPNYESITLALQACRHLNRAYSVSLEIMSRLKTAKVPVTETVLAAYAAALVSAGKTDLAMKAVEKWKSGKVTAAVPLEMVSASSSDEVKGEIRGWIEERYPDILGDFDAGLDSVKGKELEEMRRAFFGDGQD